MPSDEVWWWLLASSVAIRYVTCMIAVYNITQHLPTYCLSCVYHCILDIVVLTPTMPSIPWWNNKSSCHINTGLLSKFSIRKQLSSFLSSVAMVTQVILLTSLDSQTQPWHPHHLLLQIYSARNMRYNYWSVVYANIVYTYFIYGLRG